MDNLETWNQIAVGYDRDIGMDETVMGVGLIRRWALWGIRTGKVLEVARLGRRDLGDAQDS